MRFLLLICIFISSATLAQKKYIIQNIDAEVSLDNYVQIAKNTNPKTSFKNIQSQIFLSLASLEQKLSPHTFHWLKLVIENQSRQDQNFVLFIGALNYVDIQIFENDKLISQQQTGRLVAQSQKKEGKGRGAQIPIHFKRKAKYTFYIKIWNQDRRAIHLKPRLYTAQKWEQLFADRNLFQGLLQGMLWVLIIYQIAIFFLVKYKSYLYSIIFLLSWSIYSASTSGILTESILAEFPLFNEYLWMIMVYILTILFYILFIRTFANSKIHTPKWDKALMYSFGLVATVNISSSIYLLFDFNLGLLLLWIRVLVFPSIICVIGLSISLIILKIRETQVMAYGVLIFAIFVAFEFISNILKVSGQVSNMYVNIGFVLQSIFFTTALAQRTKIKEEAKRAVEKQNAELIQNQNTILESKVRKRTTELEEKNTELTQQQQEILNQKDFVDKQNKLLDRKNKFIESSIKSAESIQKAILPYQGKLDELLKKYFIIHKPKDVVSGDFYWLNEVNHKIILVVADCTGHGVPGAFMTLIGANLLDKIIRVRDIDNPDEILTHLHTEIKIVLEQDKTGNNDGMDAVVLALEKEDNQTKVTFAGAKNSLYYVLTNSQEIQELKGTRKSIGGQQNEDKQFVNQEIVFPKDSILYLGSDGLEDQNDQARKKLGTKNLKKLLSEVKDLPLNTQKSKIEETLKLHMQGTEQRDDILWLGIQI